ncbi:NUDIX hydrolase [Frankia sp. Cj3]|uniref:NUDIX hydrolase n=1 Tax=Frankia sp. Cj3 TaxID=2880976 RepID=UPI001EF56F26|nr:NUDIX domain-containing protein [Frankia sp. Cj3]
MATDDNAARCVPQPRDAASPIAGRSEFEAGPRYFGFELTPSGRPARARRWQTASAAAGSSRLVSSHDAGQNRKPLVTAERTDRRPTPGTRAGPVTLTCLGASTEPPFDAVTSDGLLVAADLARGLDIPGGHVQQHEKTIEQTVRREAWEEVRVRLGKLTLVEVIESDYFGADDVTYMVIYTAPVTRLAPWEAGHESAGRVILPPEEFLQRYHGGDPALMRHLVSSALTVPGTPSGHPSVPVP